MKQFLWVIIAFLAFACNNDDKQSPTSENTVHFPEISEPLQLVNNGKETLYASYYGINSFSANQKYATVLETDIKFRLPTEDDPATLGMVDLETMEFIPLTTTRAWNFQQGCMAHWLATSPDSLIIYNDLRNGKFVQPEEFTSDWRCYIHCRWSPEGNLIGFNSTHTGSRQAYLLKLTF